MEVIIDGVRYMPEPPPLKPSSRSTTLGQRLRHLRDSRRWSLDDAATNIGISKTYLWELESGNAGDMSLRIAAGIARAYRVSLDYIAAGY